MQAHVHTYLCIKNATYFVFTSDTKSVHNYIWAVNLHVSFQFYSHFLYVFLQVSVKINCMKLVFVTMRLSDNIVCHSLGIFTYFVSVAYQNLNCPLLMSLHNFESRIFGYTEANFVLLSLPFAKALETLATQRKVN